MIDAPIAFAFAAGLVATLNPCGFAMLPAYLSYFLGLEQTDAESPPDTGVPRALVVGATVSLGFLVVFAAAGSLMSAGVRAFIDYVPWVSLLIGVGLVALGLAMLWGFQLRVALPSLEVGGRSRRLTSLFVFGVSYAVCSLSCTLPVFLTVVSGTVTRSNFVSGLVAFIAYALGMSVVLLVLTLAVATAKGALVRHIRGAVRYVGRVSGALLVLAGGYIAYYWGVNLARDPAKGGSAPGARWGERLSRQVSTWIDNVGTTRLGILLGGLLAAAVAYTVTLRWLTRRYEKPPVSSRETVPDDRPHEKSGVGAAP